MLSQEASPGLLDRLCRLTVEVLECDTSHTLLWHPEESAYTAVASHGSTADEQVVIATARVPRAVLSALLERLETDDVALVGTGHAPVSAAGDSVPTQLCMALRRGTDVIGIQVATRRTGPFREPQLRIARGVAQLASLMLAHARGVAEFERVYHLKAEFVATISHELRTPLNVILGYSDLLLAGAFGELSEIQTDTLRRMFTNGCVLRDLISQTLDLSRLETGPVQLVIADIDLAQLIAEIDSEIRDISQRPGVALSWALPPAPPTLRSDEAKLKLVLKNLIGNAMKFTDAGRVQVSVREHNAGVLVRVADTGPGIPQDQLTVIFEPFRQGNASHTHRHGGVGLGLYIVRRFLDVLGGSIMVESELGKGSVFEVWLPAVTPPRNTPPIVAA